MTERAPDTEEAASGDGISMAPHMMSIWACSYAGRDENATGWSLSPLTLEHQPR